MDTNLEGYTKIDVLSVEKSLFELTKWLKSGIPTEKLSEYSKYVNKMYLEIDKQNKSIKVSFPQYGNDEFEIYLKGLIEASKCVGFELYLKEVTNGK